VQCRGLILDDQDRIVARGFNKFFNYEEIAQTDLIPTQNDSIWVQKKMDGSLGILFNYDGEWHMATRGSFESDQSKAGLEIAKAKYDLSQFDPLATYLCEIIYPENRIVVDYGGDSKLVFLSAVQNGEELSWEEAVDLFSKSGISKEDVVETVQHSDFSPENWSALKAEQLSNEEGFVVRFWPSGVRAKVKFTEYVRLHRILTNFSNLDLWESLRLGKDLITELDRVPDEFDEWVKSQIAELNRLYFSLFSRAFKLLERLHAEGFETRKDQAQWIKVMVEPDLQPVIFKLLDGNDPSQLLWKLVKPVHSKPLKNLDSE
jgi:RNA ligase